MSTIRGGEPASPGGLVEQSTSSCVVLAEVKTRLVVLSVMVSTIPLAGCASSGTGTNGNARETSIVLSVGSSAPYDLYTHCGVLSATINGQIFYAIPPLTDGSGNPPPGWGNPYDGGEMTLRSLTTADFRDVSGHSAHFASSPQGTGTPVCS